MKNAGRKNGGREKTRKQVVLTTNYCRRQTSRTAQNVRPVKKYPGGEKWNIGLPKYEKWTLRHSDPRGQEKAKYLIRLRGLEKLQRDALGYWKQETLMTVRRVNTHDGR